MSLNVTSSSATMTDRELQERVLDTLDTDPLEAPALGVTVWHGVVTLQGTVHSREQRWIAERWATEVPGVRAVANELEVVADREKLPDDSLLAEAALNALSWYRATALEAVKVIVSDRWITLTGMVADLRERGAAERAVCRLRGVRGVSNALTIAQPPRSRMEGVVVLAPYADGD